MYNNLPDLWWQNWQDITHQGKVSVLKNIWAELLSIKRSTYFYVSGTW